MGEEELIAIEALEKSGYQEPDIADVLGDEMEIKRNIEEIVGENLEDVLGSGWEEYLY